VASMAVCSMAFSPDGEYLAAGYMSTHLCLWQPATGKLLHNIQTRAEGTVAFSHDGKFVVSTGPLSDAIHFYNPAKGQEVRTIHSPQGAVYAVAFAPDSRTIASAGQDGTILIWNLEKK
jgi:WD40 repeat protein